MLEFLNTRGGRLTAAVAGIVGVYAIDSLSDVVKTGMERGYGMKAESPKYGSVSLSPGDVHDSLKQDSGADKVSSATVDNTGGGQDGI